MNIIVGKKYIIVNGGGGAFMEGQVVVCSGAPDPYGHIPFISDRGLRQWYSSWQVKPIITQMVNK